jgi:hypothetical protein
MMTEARFVLVNGLSRSTSHASQTWHGTDPRRAITMSAISAIRQMRPALAAVVTLGGPLSAVTLLQSTSPGALTAPGDDHSDLPPP